MEYSYNPEYQTLVQYNQQGEITMSMYIPEQDLSKLEMLLWSIQVDKAMEDSDVVE